MTELFESTIDNVRELEVKGYSDPVNMERTMEIWAKRGDEEYLYKFTGPGVRVVNIPMVDDCLNLAKKNEKLNARIGNLVQQNTKLKEENEALLEGDHRFIRKQLSEALMENKKLKEAYEKLQQDNTLNKKSADTWSKECYRLYKKVDKLHEENGKLKKDLKEIQEAFPMTANKILYGEGELKVENEDTNNVNHPSHYETGNFECIEVMQEVFGIGAVINFCKCNAFKYVYRMDRKNGTEDAKKAIWYLNKYLELQDKLTSELFDDGGEIWHGERHTSD